MKYVIMLVVLISTVVVCETYAQTREQLFFDAVKHNKADEVRDSVRNVNANVRDVHLNTPLMFAALNGNHDIMKYLLAAGADPNAYSDDGTTPLGAAVLGGDEDAVEMLLKAGARPNDCDTKGYSPLMFAAMKGNHSIMGDLIKAGAEVNHQARDGKTALMLAATSGDDMSIVKLMDAHADINMQDAGGNTALMYAVDYTNPYGVATLYDYTPKINLTNRKGESALYKSVITHQPIVILMLLARSPEIDPKTLKGKSIYQLEGEIKDPGVIMALSVLDTTLYHTAGGISGPGTTPNVRGFAPGFMNKQRNLAYPSDARFVPDLPDENMRGNEMINFLMHNSRVRSFDMSHSHLQRHIDYINTVYHTPAQIENANGGGNAPSGVSAPTTMPSAH